MTPLDWQALIDARNTARERFVSAVEHFLANPTNEAAYHRLNGAALDLQSAQCELEEANEAGG